MRVPFSVFTILFLLTGFLAGYQGLNVPEGLMSLFLDALIVSAGFAIGVELSRLEKSVWNYLISGGILSVSTVLSSMTGGILVSYILNADLRVGAAIGGAAGWYSLAGPLISTIDPYWGLIGFLANLLREIIHLSMYPLLARCCRFPGISVGGATTMDTGLPVVTLYGGRKAGLIAMVHGGLITLLAPFVLQLVLFY